MSQHIATIQAIYAAFAKGDVPSILAHLAEDVQWEWGWAQDSGIPWYKPGKGRKHVEGFFGALRQVEIKTFQPLALLGDNQWVAVPIDLEAKVVATGRTVKEVEMHLWGFNEAGKVNKFRHYVDSLAHFKAFKGH